MSETDAAPAAAGADTITTGVARARDRLDSATSTSSIREAEIERLAPRSIGDLLRAIPGIRSEPSTGEGQVSVTVRGLPLASSGIKFLQLQEDGLPLLEFDDVQGGGADALVRTDLTLAQVEVIRGGSASTFASNSPGGLINFLSQTGETEGGAIALSTGLDYESYRTDLALGGKLSDTLRFHVGGFYRQGEGPRTAGYDAQRGGQIKANVTRSFADGYVRLYGKYLDDRTPLYDTKPMRATGTDANPRARGVAGFDPSSGVLLSRYLRDVLVLGADNRPRHDDVAEGQGARVTAIGLESQLDLAGWTITERFRVAATSSALVAPFSSIYLPAGQAAALLGGAGARLFYANGPAAGSAIADPGALNGNGLLALLNIVDLRVRSQRHVVNDVRASRIWPLAAGELTATAGFYAGRQAIDRDTLWSTMVSDVRGDGRAALVDVVTAGGRASTRDGVFAYGPALIGAARRRSIDLDYTINAPFASLNYHRGTISVGGSLRYDAGRATGRLRTADTRGGGTGLVSRDVDGDGALTAPETRVGITRPVASPLDYDYGYLSYSSGVTWRVAEPFALFARYSRGARANADRILFSAIIARDGSLALRRAAYDPVRQAELGAKYRHAGLTLNVTGFWAKAQDTNVDTVSAQVIEREYRAAGLEFEGAWHVGPVALSGGATLTDAEITRDAVNPAMVGNTPRHQARLIFQAMPQLVTERVNVGAAVIGTTASYSQDTNLLRTPGYVTTNAFVQLRAAARLRLSLNANNLFDVAAVTAFDDASIPRNRILRARLLNGRTVSATLRLDF